MGGGNMVDYMGDARWEEKQAQRRKREIGTIAWDKENAEKAAKKKEYIRTEALAKAKRKLKEIKKLIKRLESEAGGVVPQG
jgi:hypothetical protein